MLCNVKSIQVLADDVKRGVSAIRDSQQKYMDSCESVFSGPVTRLPDLQRRPLVFPCHVTLQGDLLLGSVGTVRTRELRRDAALVPLVPDHVPLVPIVTVAQFTLEQIQLPCKTQTLL